MAKDKHPSNPLDFENMTLEELLRPAENAPVEDPNAPDTEFTETRREPTPNGGAYSRAYYYDKNCIPCPKAKARFVNIVEYDKNGKRINEVYGELSS